MAITAEKKQSITIKYKWLFPLYQVQYIWRASTRSKCMKWHFLWVSSIFREKKLLHIHFFSSNNKILHIIWTDELRSLQFVVRLYDTLPCPGKPNTRRLSGGCTSPRMVPQPQFSGPGHLLKAIDLVLRCIY